MLFGYPVEATHNNWLHDCLCEAVRSVHAAIDAGVPIPAWPEMFPAAHREALRARTGLRDRLQRYDVAVRGLEKAQRDGILDALDAENRIAELLSGELECVTVEDLPESARAPVSDLFDFAFGLLTALEIRDSHYLVIYEAAEEHLCPFCGVEYFDAPTAPREDLDHYLAKNRYPFAAANLRNLVPMGGKCNSSYKLATDLLRKTDGTRRVAFDPYLHTGIRITLQNSQAFGGVNDNTPAWNVGFVPDSPAAATWDEVFAICERYRRDHLDPCFVSWLRLFGKWIRIAGMSIETDQELVACLQRYEAMWADSGVSDRAFLKAEVFRLLRQHCQMGNQRLLQQLRDLATPIPQVVAE